MESYIIAVIVYFLITGLINVGGAITGFLPAERNVQTPAAGYAVIGVFMLAFAIWGAAIL